MTSQGDRPEWSLFSTAGSLLFCFWRGLRTQPGASFFFGAAGPSRDSPTVPCPLCLFAVISGNSLVRPVKTHCTGRWFLLPVTEPWTTLSVQAAGKERCPPHPSDLCTPILFAFTRSFVQHTACFLCVRCCAGSGGLPHNPVKKLCYDPRFTGWEPRRREGQPSAEGCTARKCRVGRGPGIPAPHLALPRGLLLSSAPRWFTPVRLPHSNHPPGSPGWLRGQGGLPSRLQGFRLKSALSRLWASTLRNCGMPSLALKSTVIF